MRVIQVTATAASDGVIRLNIPVGTSGSEYELAVVVSPRPAPTPADSTRPKTPEELGWPPGYFENVIGSIDDETFMIHPQPPAESSRKPVSS